MSFVINFVDLSVCDISQSQNGTMSKSHQLKKYFKFKRREIVEKLRGLIFRVFVKKCLKNLITR